MKNSKLFYLKMKSIVALLFFLCISCNSQTLKTDNKSTSSPISEKDVAKKDTIIDFESSEILKEVQPFVATASGKMQYLNWKIIKDNNTKVIMQQATNDGDYYNLLVLEKPVYKNFTMSAKIKAIAGNEDQGGGLVWRYSNNNNYYIARFNPLENNFRLYKVVNGDREKLKSVDFEIKSNEWFEMKIEMIENQITCYLNNKILIQIQDDTFPNSGRVGFWTKADAQTEFDDLTLKIVK